MAEVFTESLANIMAELSLDVAYLPKNAEEILVSSRDINRPGLELTGFLDFYDVNGRPYIGEMTFTPSGFNGDSLTPEARMEIGKFLDLTKIPSKMLKNPLPKNYKK